MRKERVSLPKSDFNAEHQLSAQSGMALDPWIDKVMGCFRIQSKAIQKSPEEPVTVGGVFQFTLDRAKLAEILIALCEHRVATDKAREKVSGGGIILPGR